MKIRLPCTTVPTPLHFKALFLSCFFPLPLSAPSTNPGAALPTLKRTMQSNYLYFREGGGRTVSLGGKNTVNVKSGDRLTILTPGGGGHGSPSPSMIASNGGEGNGNSKNDNRRDEEENAAGEDPDRKSRRLADMRLFGSLSEYRLGQEQA